MQLYVPYFEDHLPEAQILLIDACAHGQVMVILEDLESRMSMI